MQELVKIEGVGRFLLSRLLFGLIGLSEGPTRCTLQQKETLKLQRARSQEDDPNKLQPRFGPKIRDQLAIEIEEH